MFVLHDIKTKIIIHLNGIQNLRNTGNVLTLNILGLVEK